MVEAPEREPLAGAKLVRSVAKGPQDLTISESTNAISRALWERLDGRLAPLMSLDWFRLLKPAGAAVSLLSERYAAARADAVRAARRRGHEGMDARGLAPPAPAKRISVETTPSDEDFAAAVLALSRGFAFRPAWSADATMAPQARAAKVRYGPLHRAIVRAAKGALLGCYLYHGAGGGTGRVLQLLAEAGEAGAVVDCLIREAHAAGLVALRGRMIPRLADALRAQLRVRESRRDDRPCRRSGGRRRGN